MQYRYTIHKEEDAYNGFFKFKRYHLSFEKFDGGFIEGAIRECGKKGDIVGVLPYDPVTQEFILVEQFRIGMVARGIAVPWTMEIVAGFMDAPGEQPAETAKRELLEETGCEALTLHPLIDYYPSPGGSATKNHLFIATVDATTALKYTGLLEETEDICVHRIPLSVMKSKWDKGEIDNATSLIAFQQFFAKHWEERLK